MEDSDTFFQITVAPYPLSRMSHMESSSLFKEFKLVIENFDLVTHVRLLAPYVTDCVEYGEDVSFTQRGCYENCLNEYYMSIYGKLSPYIPVFEWQRMPIAFNITEVPSDVSRQCNTRCRKPACTEKYYKPALFEAPYSFLMLYPRNEISEIHTSKLSNIEFILIVLGNAGFWFGLCFTQLLA